MPKTFNGPVRAIYKFFGADYTGSEAHYKKVKNKTKMNEGINTRGDVTRVPKKKDVVDETVCYTPDGEFGYSDPAGKYVKTEYPPPTPQINPPTPNDTPVMIDHSRMMIGSVSKYNANGEYSQGQLRQTLNSFFTRPRIKRVTGDPTMTQYDKYRHDKWKRRFPRNRNRIYVT
jgi:hypothetical protein